MEYILSEMNHLHIPVPYFNIHFNIVFPNIPEESQMIFFYYEANSFLFSGFRTKAM
jgi:hypothetical protein